MILTLCSLDVLSIPMKLFSGAVLLNIDRFFCCALILDATHYKQSEDLGEAVVSEVIKVTGRP